MERIKAIGAAVILSVLPVLSQAQATTLDWYPIGELPDGTGGEGQASNLGMAGPFVGVHNDALIIAGGANFPIPKGHELWDKAARKIYYDRIWVATRGKGRDDNGDGKITPAERPLTWYETKRRLPGNRAYGAAASHALGLIAVGGTDGNTGYSDAHLLRWNKSTVQVDLLQLPPVPSVSVDSGAAIIGDKLYLMVGSNGVSTTGNLYTFDLSRIKTDADGNPLVTDGQALITERRDAMGRSVNPWQKLPSIPQSEGENLSRSHMMVVAQNDGRGDRLYVIGGRRTTTLSEHPDAVPVGLGEKQFFWHIYSDVWVYNPDAENNASAWTRKENISVDGQPVGRSAGTAITNIAEGQPQILLLSGSDGKNLRKAFGELQVGWADFPAHPGFERQVLAYNAMTDTWSRYNKAPLMLDPMGAEGHEVAVNAVTTTAVHWDGDIILASGEVRPKVRSPKIWAITDKGSK